MQGRITGEKYIFQVPFPSRNKKNVPVIFYVCTPQESIKINFKSLSTSYHWIPVSCCYSSQATYFYCNPMSENPSANPCKGSMTDRKHLETHCVLVTFKLFPHKKVTLFTPRQILVPGQNLYYGIIMF